MSEEVTIQSPRANIILAVIGSVFLLASFALLVDYVITTWGAASIIDRALQCGLVGCAAVGALLVRRAWPHVRQVIRSRELPGHRAATAASR